MSKNESRKVFIRNEKCQLLKKGLPRYRNCYVCPNFESCNNMIQTEHDKKIQYLRNLNQDNNNYYF